MRTIIVFLLCFIASLSTAQSVQLTPQQMKADLEYLNKYLRKWHPSYYDYTKKEEMNAFYSRLKDSCTTATSSSIFRTSVYKAINKVGCGHMGVWGFRGVASGKSAALLPIKVWVLGNRLFIKSALKKDSVLTLGDEILEINGEKAADLIEKTAELAVTDGVNKTYKAYSLEYNFNAFHYFIYGKQDSYALKIKNRAGEVSDISIKSDTLKDAFTTYKMVKDTANQVIAGDAVALYKTDFDASTMVIDIDNFNGSGQGRTFKKIFRHLRTHDIKNVVIDLRDNGGGNVFRGNKFLTYFLDAPITPVVISKKPNLTFINPRFKGGFFEKITPILFTLNPLQYPNRNGWNHCFLFFKKYRNHFDGNVYVMTNGGTFSMASYVASYLKYKKHAVVVGEETGGSAYGSRAMAGGHITLPNSEVKVQFNIYQMTHRLNIEDKGHGVMPDHATQYSIDDKLKGKGLDIEAIKNLIKK
jgi:C-terminal processing protease CtpA/Prc